MEHSKIKTKIKTKKNIYLIGPMGAGKSSVGKQLEKLIAATYLDSDTEIEKRTGVTIAWIFEKEKESGFRKRENKIIKELTQRNHIILSTGGGSVLSKDNRHRLTSTGLVIYLRASLDQQLNRIQQSKIMRPLLNGPDPRETLFQLNKNRQSIYESMADITIDTDCLNPKETAEIIVEQLESGVNVS